MLVRCRVLARCPSFTRVKLNEVLLEASRPYVEQACSRPLATKPTQPSCLDWAARRLLSERMEKFGIKQELTFQ